MVSAAEQPAKLIPVLKTAAEVSLAPQDAAPAQTRPSPFAEADRASESAPRQSKPVPVAPKVVAGIRTPPAPIKILPRTPPSVPPAELPAAPTLLPRPSGNRVELPQVSACCVATATIEPVIPSAFRRALQKVPGLRRLQHRAETEDGFLPAKPGQDVTLWVPPGAAGRTALQKRRMDLKATVDPSGGVTQVELLAPKDEHLLSIAAYAASRWKFVPARLGDQAVASQVILHFQFDDR
jgi:hypothetical protein